MELILETPEGDLYYDEEHHIIKCAWHGHVRIEIFKQIIKEGTRICLEKKKPMALLLDRRDLDGYSNDAKTYLLDDYLKNEGKVSKDYVYKVAIIPPKTFAAQAKAKLFTRIIRFAATSLPIKVFDDEFDAIKWLKLKLVTEEVNEDVEQESTFDEFARKSIFRLFRSKKSKK